MKIILSAIFVLFISVLTSISQVQNSNPPESEKKEVEKIKDEIINLNLLKISGYLQPQFQWGQQSANLRVGTNNVDPNNVGLEKPYNRIGIRRGRLKLTYNEAGLAAGTFHLNIIDRPGLRGATVQLKEAYFTLKDPFIQAHALRAGVFDRPFGNEVNYSSSQIESPERSRIINTLFPEESDLGAILILNAPANSFFNFLKFEGGLFAGNAINPDSDNRKDFIGRLMATKPLGSSANWGLSASYYNGGVYQTNSVVYTMLGNQFSKNQSSSNIGAYAKREYFGFDGQFSIETALGITQLRAEYIWGNQPGNELSSNSPNRASLPNPEDTYIRPFNGGYGILIQDIGFSPFSAVLKYEFYDPNTAVHSNDLGLAGSYTSATDVKYSTLGIGCLWKINSYIRLQAYYEFVQNETSTNLSNASVLSDYSKDMKDNMLTVRMQYRF